MPATVVSSDKKGDCYLVIVCISLPRFRGSFNSLHFGENVPATGSYYDGTLELRYFQDPGFSVGDSFPLWRD